VAAESELPYGGCPAIVKGASLTGAAGLGSDHAPHKKWRRENPECCHETIAETGSWRILQSSILIHIKYPYCDRQIRYGNIAGTCQNSNQGVVMGRAGRIAGFLVPLAAAAPVLAQQSHARYNLQEPVTGIAEQINDMHTLMLVICLLIFIVVFGVMFWAVIHHRKARGAVAAHFHENTTVEIAWTIVPLLILLGMAWPATRTVIEMKDTSNPDITIKATGYQWKWGYDYLQGEGEGIRFLSALSTPREQIEGGAPKGDAYLLEVDNPLVVPVGKKIRVVLTANDVIHSWWVPAFGVKQDAIPGFIRDTWFRADKEGVFRGNCAELCGRDHGFMPVVVHVVSAEKYAEWVKAHKAAAAVAADAPPSAPSAASGPAAGKS
jgi:cytochrome c oxidase subunit 2